MILLLEDILRETVDPNDVKDAIRNKYYVSMRYDDTEPEVNGSKKRRVVMPLAIGTTKAGHPVFRAFQVSGNSKRGAPNKYKYFRLDRVTSWNPLKNKKFFTAPDERYNPVGDKSMSHFEMNAQFDDFTDTLELVRAKGKEMANMPKMSTKNASGPISAANQWKKNVFTSNPNSKKYQQIAKNILDTSKDKRFDDDIWAKAEREREDQDRKLMDLRGGRENDISSTKGPIGKDYDEYDVEFDENEWNNFNKKNMW